VAAGILPFVASAAQEESQPQPLTLPPPVSLQLHRRLTRSSEVLRGPSNGIYPR
jgi:hypothetical protein